MPFNWQQVSADLRQKYEHTFVWVTTQSGEEELFFIERITENNAKPIMQLRNNSSGSIILNYDTSCTISFRFPDTGFFWHEKEALIFQRFSARRYKKGIAADNSEIYGPYDSFSKARVRNMTEEMLLSAFKPWFPSYLGAVKILEEQHAACVPLNRHIAIGLSPDRDLVGSHIIWAMEIPVAVVVENRVEIKEAHFKQEILDYFRGTGANVQTI